MIEEQSDGSDYFTGTQMSKYEARWLDMGVHSQARAHSVALAVNLYREYRKMDKMFSEYQKTQRMNARNWENYRQWIKQIPAGVWPNGKAIEPPEGVILSLKQSSLQREMKRAGVSIPVQKSRFKLFRIGEEWRLVAEKMRWQDKHVSRFNVAHMHPNTLPYLTGFWELPPINKAMGEIKLGKCCVCSAEMPRHIEAWMRMNRLSEKLDG